MKYRLLITLLSILLSASLICNAEDTITVIINSNIEYQTIDGFGASDAWRCQFIGKNYPIEKREKIAELLFSTELDKNQNPKGIGLSIWRFNIGGGSAELGDSSDIKNIWRRAECFQDSAGNYDWNKQQGQQWFLNKANEYGVNTLLAFTNSPPVHMTNNGKTYAKKGDYRYNIKPGMLDDYARFLVDVTDYFYKQGIVFDYISPVNEPQWNWEKSTQEGSPALNEDIYMITKYLSYELSKTNLPARIIIGEAAEIDFLYECKKGSSKGDQIENFYNKNSPLYIGNLPHVSHKICAHSYFTTWPLTKQVNTRMKLADKLFEIDSTLGYWQSEFCILEKNPETTGGRGRDLGMNTALYVARVIHNDLTITMAQSWQWWTAISQVNYKDGLIHIDLGEDNNGIWHKANDSLSDAIINDGYLRDTKLLWAFGNYARFIRPGMVRIDATIDGQTDPLEMSKNIMISAYRDKKNDNIGIVFVNVSNISKKANIKFSSIEHLKNNIDMYITSENENLSHFITNINEVNIPGRSIVTLLY